MRYYTFYIMKIDKLTFDELEKLEILERRSLRKIMAAFLIKERWKLWSNKDIYQNVERILEIRKKRRLEFFGHLYKTN